MVKLTTMTRNSLADALEMERVEEVNPGDVTPQAVAQLSYEQLKGVYSIGKLGLRDVIAWLAEAGLEPAGGVPAKVRGGEVTQARIDDAIALLERHGYEVRKLPNEGGEVDYLLFAAHHDWSRLGAEDFCMRGTLEECKAWFKDHLKEIAPDEDEVHHWAQIVDSQTMKIEWFGAAESFGVFGEDSYGVKPIRWRKGE